MPIRLKKLIGTILLIVLSGAAAAALFALSRYTVSAPGAGGN